MSLYERKSFSVPASAGKPETCVQVGHTEPDQRGKCLRCGGKVRLFADPLGYPFTTVLDAALPASERKAMREDIDVYRWARSAGASIGKQGVIEAQIRAELDR